jgi:hypothetical protein
MNKIKKRLKEKVKGALFLFELTITSAPPFDITSLGKM